MAPSVASTGTQQQAMSTWEGASQPPYPHAWLHMVCCLHSSCAARSCSRAVVPVVYPSAASHTSQRGQRGTPAAQVAPCLVSPAAHSPLSTSVKHVTCTVHAGAGSQQDFMLRDHCIVVSEQDAILKGANKYDCHR